MDFDTFADTPLRKLVPILADSRARQTLFDGLRQTRDRENRVINGFEWRSERIPQHPAGPLNGLPITVKDQFAVAGCPRSFGRDRSPHGSDATSAPLVEQLIQRGAIVTGKTTLPPNALDFQTFNRRRGVTRNPVNADFTAGGSSGGGASAVASGMSLLDIGADLAGSLRLPTAWCGAVSLTPGEGVLPAAGMLPGSHVLPHFARPGPIARRVDDLRFFWEIVHPDEPERSSSLSQVYPVLEPRFMDATTTRLWTRFHDRCKPLTKEGDITATGWLFDTEIYRLYGEIMGHETGAMLAWPLRWLARRDREAEHSSPGFLAHVHRGYARSAARYRENLERLDVLRRAAIDRIPKGTALVLPVSGVCAFRHLTPSRDRNGVRSYSQKFALNGGALGYLDALTRFTVPLSLLGWPVVTLPVDRDENGLPFGVQLSAPPGSEAELFSLAELVQDTLASERN